MSNLMPLTTPRDDQPASAWASSTLSALGPTSDQTPSPKEQPFLAAVETPDLDIPGGFPAPKPGFVETDIYSANGAAMDVLGTAKQFAQNAAQSAQIVIQNAGEKVGDYLPTGVASYLPSKQSVASGTGGAEENTKTLPSQETSQNYHPSSSGGVGVLPGPPGEIGVAILPDERNDKSVTTNVTKTSNNHPYTDSSSHLTGETLHDDTSLSKSPEERRLETLPSHDDDTKGHLGKSSGVGALPGPVDESSVALLPDERNQSGEKATSYWSTINNSSTDASTRTLLGSYQDGGQVGQIHLHHSPHTEGREHTLSRDEEKLFGSDALKKLDVPGPGENLGLLSKSQPPRKSSTDSHRVAGTGSVGLAGSGDSGHLPSTSPKKSGFIHKVKGEMKILSGKMSHNESKVEEGRKMVGKN